MPYVLGCWMRGLATQGLQAHVSHVPMPRTLCALLYRALLRLCSRGTPSTSLGHTDPSPVTSLLWQSCECRHARVMVFLMLRLYRPGGPLAHLPHFALYISTLNPRPSHMRTPWQIPHLCAEPEPGAGSSAGSRRSCMAGPRLVRDRVQ